MQYKATKDIDDFQIFFCEQIQNANGTTTYNTREERSRHFGSIKKRDVWTTVSFFISVQEEKFGWGKKGDMMRFDFGSVAENDIQIQYLGINGTDTWTDIANKKENHVNKIARYLSNTYPAEITNVEVTQTHVIISGKTVEAGCKLVDRAIYAQAFDDIIVYDVDKNLPVGEFTVTVPRYVYLEGINGEQLNYDRLLSRWGVVNSSNQAVSHCRYADKVYELDHAAPGVFKSKKGIGGIMKTACSDIVPLGIHTATFNITANNFIACNKTDYFTLPYTYCDRTYYINPTKIAEYDEVLKECENNGVVVAAIILFKSSGGTDSTGEIEYNHYMHHEECTGGNYSMPDMTDLEGVHAYAATINYLADRYSKTGNGRIHHWILQNEVDAHSEWTNMGNDPKLLRYIETYERSLRLTSNVVRQYDPNAYVLASLTSSWTKPQPGNSKFFPAKTILNHLQNYSRLEGDFRWGIAYHPYPQSFSRPDFWASDADTEATYSENAGFCTFKNMEVISNWVLKRENYYKGEEKRILFFSENGTNSIDLTEENQKIQAAGAAWAWKKANHNAGVDAIMWHNWFDHPVEVAAGLRLGLRDNNQNPKKSWYVWQAAGTANEPNVLDPYLATLGKSSWDEINKGVSVDGEDWYRINFDLSSASGTSATYDGNYQCYNFTTTNTDPQILTETLTKEIAENSNTLAFDYKASSDFEFQVFFSPLATEVRSIIVPLKATGSAWKRTYINIAAYRRQYVTGSDGNDTEYIWGKKTEDLLRVDLGGVVNNNIGIRHFMINSGQVEETSLLPVTEDGSENCTVTEPTPGAYQAVTTGNDPKFYTKRLGTNLVTEAKTLLYEYKSDKEIATLQFFFVDHAGELRSVKVLNVPAAATWTRQTVDITNIVDNHGWGFEGDYIRIDPGSYAGTTFQIRNIHVNDGHIIPAEFLTLDSTGAHSQSLTRDINMTPDDIFINNGPDLVYNQWYINTLPAETGTATDPRAWTTPLEYNLDPKANLFHIVYKSSVDISPLEIFYLSPEAQARAKKYYNIMPASSDWKHIVINIDDMRKELGWGYAGDALRLDFGDVIGADIQIQTLVINYDEKTTDSPEIPEDNFTICGTVGGVIINSTEKQLFAIYNTLGVNIRKMEIEGEAFVSLLPGLYIVNGKKVVVK